MILGELMAQTIERYAGLPVDRRLNLGGTFICDRALQTGDIDLYVEYSGTALTAVFKQPVQRDPAAGARGHPRAATRTPAGRCWRRSASTTRSRSSCAAPTRAARGLTRLSQLARTRPAGAPASATSSSSAQDGYRGLAATYGLRFREPPRVMDLTLIYRALAEGQVDVIAGDATAGLIDALDLVDARRRSPVLSALRRRPGRARGDAAASPGDRRALARLERPRHGRGDAPDELRR